MSKNIFIWKHFEKGIYLIMRPLVFEIPVELSKFSRDDVRTKSFSFAYDDNAMGPPVFSRYLMRDLGNT